MKRLAILALLLTACVKHQTIGMTPDDGSSSDGGATESSTGDATSSSSSAASSDGSDPSSESGAGSECGPGGGEIELVSMGACGDMAWLGSTENQLLVDGPPSLSFSIRVPSMIGMPFVEGVVTATYTLPHPDVEVRAFVSAQQDETECDPEGQYDVIASEMTAVAGTLEVSLIDRPNVGCLFTCDDAHAYLQDARFLPDECDMDAPGFTADSIEIWGDVLPD